MKINMQSIAASVSSILMALILALSIVPQTAFAETTPTTPTLSIYGSKTFNMEANKKDLITISVRNSGTDPVTITDAYVESSTLNSCSINNSLINETIAGGDTKTVQILVDAPDKDLTHTVALSLYYSHGNPTQFGETTLNITVAAKTTQTTAPSTSTNRPEIILDEPIGYIEMEAGGSKTVNMVLRNTTAYTATNWNIKAVANPNFSISFVGDDHNFFSFANKATKTIPVKITAPSNLKADTYTVKFNYTYKGGSNSDYTGTAEFYVRIAEKTTEKPLLVIKDVKAPSTIKAGDNFTLTASIENSKGTSAPAKNVQFVVTGLKNDAISIYNGPGSHSYASITGTQTSSINLRASERMASGAYPVDLIATYYDDEGKDYKATYTYYIVVENNNTADRAYLEVTGTSVPTGTFKPGDNFTVTLSVKNTGSVTAKSIKLTADGGANILPQSSNIQQVKSIAPGETKNVSFTFSPSAAAATQNHSIGFTVAYDTGATIDGKAETDTFNQFVGVNVSNPKKDEEEDKDDTTTKSIPKIIVSHYRVDPEIVQAGQNFDLHISFQNTHSKKTISNIQVAFSVEGTETAKGNVFTPVESSNMFYIEEMGPKGISDHVLSLYTVPDALPKNYVIRIDFDYEDEEGNPYKSTVQVGVNVKQVSKLELGDITPQPPSFGAGEFSYVYFNVHNTGKVTLNNLKIKLESDTCQIPSGEIIYGNFQSGSFDSYDSSFQIFEPGEHVIRAVVSYDTDTGENVQQFKEFTVTVFENQLGGGGEFGGPDKFPIEGFPMEEPTGGLLSHWWFWASVVGGVLIIAGVIVTVVIIRKKKKGMNFNE